MARSAYRDSTVLPLQSTQETGGVQWLGEIPGCWWGGGYRDTASVPEQWPQDLRGPCCLQVPVAKVSIGWRPG